MAGARQGRRIGRGCAPAALLVVVVLLVWGGPSPTGRVLPATPLAPPTGLSSSVLSAHRSPAAGADRTEPVPAASGLRNVEIVGACNASANSGPASAYDASPGYLYELWTGCGGIGFARSVDGGYSFGAPLTVAPSSLGAASGPSLAVGPNGSVVAGFVVNDSGSAAPYVAWSWNDGSSFAGAAPIVPPSTTAWFARPSVAVAQNGTIYVAFVESTDRFVDRESCPASTGCFATNGEYNVEIVDSSDGGAAWSSPVAVDPEAPAGGVTSVALLCPLDGGVDLAYTDYAVGGPSENLSNGTIRFSSSPDGSSGWTVPIAVESALLPVEIGGREGTITSDRSGRLYVGYSVPAGASARAFVVSSNDSGATWATPTALDAGFASTTVSTLVTVGSNASASAFAAWVTDNTTAGGWSTYLSNLSSNGTVASTPTVVSNATGLPSIAVGDSLAVNDLGAGAVAVSWSFGVSGPAGNASEAFVAIAGESAPVDAPTVTSAVPGAGTVTLRWTAPTGGDRIGGYWLAWGLAHQRTFYNLSVSRGSSSGTATGLPPGLAWAFEVAATNGAGIGPFTPPVDVTLTAWGVVEGTVTPASATVQGDGIFVQVTAGSYRWNTSIGVHLLTVAAPLYSTASVPVTLPWNGTVTQNVSLTELPGAVEGYVTPANSTVVWDGTTVPVNSTGFYSVANVTPGQHAIGATSTEYHAYAGTVAVPPGATVWENLSLVPENGTLEIDATPASLSFRVAGAVMVLTTAGHGNFSLAPGTYPIEATATGYAPYFGNVTISPASTVRVAITLNRSAPSGGSGPSTGLGISPTELSLLAVAVLLAVGVGLVVVGRRRRAARPPGAADDGLFEDDDEGTVPPTGGSAPPG